MPFPQQAPSYFHPPLNLILNPHNPPSQRPPRRTPPTRKRRNIVPGHLTRNLCTPHQIALAKNTLVQLAVYQSTVVEDAGVERYVGAMHTVECRVGFVGITAKNAADFGWRVGERDVGHFGGVRGCFWFQTEGLHLGVSLRWLYGGGWKILEMLVGLF